MKEELVILLVEDDEFDADMTIMALKKAKVPHRIVWLKTGQFLLDYLLSHPTDSISLVLMDINMPQISGLEALQIVRARGYTALPVVMLTSSNRPEEIQACYDHGCNSYVTKPVKTKDFQEAVMQLGLYWTEFNQLPSE
ncbi:MAG: response regulator [Bacteroidota bacterium]